MENNIILTALVGKSGTGKSHHAVVAARMAGASAIIDDGLLIYQNKVCAGSSAKREKTKISSVKRAMFVDKNHAKAVRDAILSNKIKSILILGTSQEMTDRIAQALEIGKIQRYIKIEDISSPEDIQKAQTLRNTQGKHIIPVPALEIKKDFSGYFLHPLRLWRHHKGIHETVADKTIVRPTYSYMGEYTISDNAIAQAAAFEAKRITGVNQIHSAVVISTASGTVINITASLDFGTPIPEVSRKISQNVKGIVEKMTAINIDKVNITIKEYRING